MYLALHGQRCLAGKDGERVLSAYRLNTLSNPSPITQAPFCATPAPVSSLQLCSINQWKGCARRWGCNLQRPGRSAGDSRLAVCPQEPPLPSGPSPGRACSSRGCSGRRVRSPAGWRCAPLQAAQDGASSAGPRGKDDAPALSCCSLLRPGTAQLPQLEPMTKSWDPSRLTNAVPTCGESRARTAIPARAARRPRPPCRPPPPRCPTARSPPPPASCLRP
jgi:hypothetical protein